jgi:TonB family protein
MAMFRLVAAAMTLSVSALPMMGAQAAEGKEAKVAPIGSPAEWFSQDDYPAEARRANQQGIVSISLTVDPTGKAVKCEVTLTSGFPSLDAVTCDVAMRRSRFTPARNASGQAVSATYGVPNVKWELDRGEHPLDVSAGHMVFFKVVTRMTVDTLGLVTACKVVENVGHMPDPCAGRLGTKGMQLVKKGKPVSGTLTSTAMGTVDPD